MHSRSFLIAIFALLTGCALGDKKKYNTPIIIINAGAASDGKNMIMSGNNPMLRSNKNINNAIHNMGAPNNDGSKNSDSTETTEKPDVVNKKEEASNEVSVKAKGHTKKLAFEKHPRGNKETFMHVDFIYDQLDEKDYNDCCDFVVDEFETYQEITNSKVDHKSTNSDSDSHSSSMGMTANIKAKALADAASVDAKAGYKSSSTSSLNGNSNFGKNKAIINVYTKKLRVTRTYIEKHEDHFGGLLKDLDKAHGEADYNSFFHKWGTHFVTDIYLGGKVAMEMQNGAADGCSDEELASSFSASLGGSAPVEGGTVGGNLGFDTSSKKNTARCQTAIKSKTHFHTVGGSGSLNWEKFNGGEADYWLQGLKEGYGLVKMGRTYDKLLPFYQLVKNKDKEHESAFFRALDKYLATCGRGSCKNGGQCAINEEGKHKCNCNRAKNGGHRYTGPHCELPCGDTKEFGDTKGDDDFFSLNQIKTVRDKNNYCIFAGYNQKSHRTSTLSTKQLADNFCKRNGFEKSKSHSTTLADIADKYHRQQRLANHKEVVRSNTWCKIAYLDGQDSLSIDDPDTIRKMDCNKDGWWGCADDGSECRDEYGSRALKVKHPETSWGVEQDPRCEMLTMGHRMVFESIVCERQKC